MLTPVSVLSSLHQSPGRRMQFKEKKKKKQPSQIKWYFSLFLLLNQIRYGDMNSKY